MHHAVTQTTITIIDGEQWSSNTLTFMQTHIESGNVRTTRIHEKMVSVQPQKPRPGVFFSAAENRKMTTVGELINLPSMQLEIITEHIKDALHLAQSLK